MQYGDPLSQLCTFCHAHTCRSHLVPTRQGKALGGCYVPRAHLCPSPGSIYLCGGSCIHCPSPLFAVTHSAPHQCVHCTKSSLHLVPSSTFYYIEKPLFPSVIRYLVRILELLRTSYSHHADTCLPVCLLTHATALHFTRTLTRTVQHPHPRLEHGGCTHPWDRAQTCGTRLEGFPPCCPA